MQVEKSVEGSIVVRVYGFLMNQHREVLIAHEYHFDMPMIKLPGGGLQFGEGLVDALRRELVEELDLKMDLYDHFHTTDFFVRSAFNENHQVIAVYYLVYTDHELEMRFRGPVVHPETNGGLAFRWVGLDELSGLEMTFQADRRALEKFLDFAASGLIRWPEKT